MVVSDPSEDRWGVRAVSVISVVSARKVDFAAQTVMRYRELNHSSREDGAPPPRRSPSVNELVKLIGRLNWRLFVTPSESTARKLNPQTTLEDLDREAIWSEVARQMGDAIATG